MEWEGLDQIVLCGHSYGGMVITGAAEALESRIKSMVYLDAFVPASGQSVLDLVSPAFRTGIEAAAGKHAGAYVDPVPAKAFMVNTADQPLVDAKCTPHPMATFRDTAFRGGDEPDQQEILHSRSPVQDFGLRRVCRSAQAARRLECQHDRRRP